jgi:cytochrome c-type biogenesis protein CcmH/NrfG
MHYDQGDYQKAIAAWETYLRQTSDDDPPRQALARLIAQARQHLQ